MPISGPNDNGDLRSQPYRPPIEEFPDKLARALDRGENPNIAPPLPHNWRFSLPSGDRQMRLSVAKRDANTSRNASG